MKQIKEQVRPRARAPANANAALRPLRSRARARARVGPAASMLAGVRQGRRAAARPAVRSASVMLPPACRPPRQPTSPCATAHPARAPRQLMEKEGIAAEQIRLIHNGKQLNDTESLESAKIEAGVTIHMVRARARARTSPRSCLVLVPDLTAPRRPAASRRAGARAARRRALRREVCGGNLERARARSRPLQTETTLRGARPLRLSARRPPRARAAAAPGC